MQTMYPAMVNSPATTLASDISSTDTTIPLVDASVLPDAPNLAVIGYPADINRETILYTGKSGNNLTGCTRGFQGTARSWDAGMPVARYFTAYDHDTFISNINEVNNLLSSHSSATSGVHGAGDNHLAYAVSQGHVVLPFTAGWTSGKLLRGAGANTSPSEIDQDIGCSLYKTQSQSIPNSTNTVVTFNAELWDTADMHDNQTNNSRITIPVAGKYHIWATIVFTTNSAGDRAAFIQRNGSTPLAYTYFGACSSVPTALPFSFVAQLSAGDYIELVVWQNSGTTLDLSAGSTLTKFGAQLICPA